MPAPNSTTSLCASIADVGPKAVASCWVMERDLRKRRVGHGKATQHVPPSRPSWPALLPFLALFGLTGIAKADDDHLLRACLAAPAPNCVDIIDARLIDIERETTDPVSRALILRERAAMLYQWGRFDVGEAALAALEALPSQQEMRDRALVDAVEALPGDAVARGASLLVQIEQPDRYEIARARHIANLAGSTDVDTALAEVAATDRANRPLNSSGTLALLYALAAAGRIDEAIEFAESPVAARTPEGRTMILQDFVHALIDNAQYDDARRVLARLDDPVWRVMATARLAAGLAVSGETAEADDLFLSARAQVVAVSDAPGRDRAFQAFAVAAAEAGRIELAIVSAREVGTDPFDHASALAAVAHLAAMRSDPVWRDIVAEAIAILEAVPQDDADTVAALDDCWQQLVAAPTVAGDIPPIFDLIGRISDETMRTQLVAMIVHFLTEDGQFPEALDLAPALDDPNLQARGLIALAMASREAGNRDSADAAMSRVYGLVESPDAPLIPINDNTIQELALWEASEGQYDLAQIRLRQVDDTWLQTFARIDIVGYTAQGGTEVEFETHLAIAKDAISRLEDPDESTTMARVLTATLAKVGRSAEALDLAIAASDPAGRDALLAELALAHRGHLRFQLAMEAEAHITDETHRHRAEQELLLGVMRAAKGEQE